MNHSLYERIEAWARVFSRRKDVTFGVPLSIVPPMDPETTLPDDLDDFARRASELRFSYKMNDGDGLGFLYLSARGIEEDVFLTIDGKDYDYATLVDVDAEGTGHSAWYVKAHYPSFIVWDVEEAVTFASLEDYLTRGARNGFRYAPSWQQPSTGAHPLFTRSISRTTPLAELRERLIALDVSPTMAQDLVDWLGEGVALLIAA